MKKILFVSFLIPALSFAQSKGFVSVEPSVYINGDANPAAGFQVSGNGEWAKSFYVGLQLGIIKFSGLSKVYIPIGAKLSYIPVKDKISPIILVEPGFGAYKYQGTTGGFTFFGGAGVAFPGKSRVFIALGYSHFGFQTDEVNSNFDALGIKIGAMLH